MSKENNCTWIGDHNARCCNESIYGKLYCKRHYDRMYIVLFPEMADYILEKEISNVK